MLHRMLLQGFVLLICLAILCIAVWEFYTYRTGKEHLKQEWTTRILLVLLLSLVLCLGSFKYAKVYDCKRMADLCSISEEQNISMYLTESMQKRIKEGYGGITVYYRGTFKTEGLDRNYMVLLNLPENLELGQKIIVERESLQLPDSRAGTGQMDFRGYCFSKNILLQGNLTGGEYKKTEERKTCLSIRIEAHKGHFTEKLERVLGKNAGLVEGMVFGDTEGVEEEELSLLTSLGLRHLFAVSGFHVGIYYCLLLLLCAAIGCQGWLRACVLITCFAYFCILTGNSASTMRASLVLTIYLIMENLQWEKRFATALAIAGMLLLFWNPYLIHDLGYKLSFAAAFGLAYLCPFFQKMYGTRIFGVGLSAWLASLPFQSIFYGVSWLGIFLTPFFSLFLALFLPCTLCAYLLDFCFLSELILVGIKPALQLLVFLVHIFENIHFISWLLENTMFHFPVTSLPRMFFYYGCLSILVWLGTRIKEEISRRDRIFVVLIIFLLVIFLGMPVPARGFEMVFINVGQGDGTLVRYKDFNMLVDTGTEKAGQYAVVPFLQSKKIEHLDLLVLTHPDHDHIGGALEVLDSVDVDYVAFSLASRNELQDEESELLHMLKQQGIPYGYHMNGDLWQIGDLMVQVLSPGRNEAENGLESNEGSLVLAVTLQEMYLQLTGDVDESMLGNLVASVEEEQIFLFKAPHHGSKGSFDEEINDQLNVDLVVVSCGKNNRYGHPHKEVTDYWQERNVPIYRTDQRGELFFRYLNGALSLEN